MNFEEWKQKQAKSGPRRYTHFDPKLSISSCLSYICNPKKIEHHAFYPFIHYIKQSQKIKNGHKAEPKKRHIYYASHIDSWIYRYYAFLYNNLYNAELYAKGLENVSIAYRTDLHMSNINFAYSAFDFLRNLSTCYVLIGDFTNFFDSLQHDYLKLRLCKLLETDRLPADHFAVFKSVTCFHFWELDDLLTYHHLTNGQVDLKKFNSMDRALNPEEFRQHKSYIKINPTPGVGVPQGSPISAVLANLYMLEADKEINSIVSNAGGIYMRYSDDFIIILPTESETNFAKYYASIINVIESTPGLLLQGSKTKSFSFSDKQIRNITNVFVPESTTNKNVIDFLGFSFDGSSIRIREKTIFKYYNRMYRKTKTIISNDGISPKGKKISCKNLYERYSYKGSLYHKQKIAKKNNLKLSSDEMRGNFLDYVNRAKKTFSDEPIDCSTRNHMCKIRRRLEQKKKTR